MNQPGGAWRESGIETQTLMIARVRDVAMRELIRIQADATLREAACAMRDHRAGCVLVEAGADSGIVTDSSLRDAMALDDISPDGLVARVARRPPVTIDSGALLLDALIQMQRHGVKRLLVTDQGRISAVLEQADVLGYFAIHSNAILQLIGSGSIGRTDLKPAADAMLRLIAALLRNGMKSDRHRTAGKRRQPSDLSPCVRAADAAERCSRMSVSSSWEARDAANKSCLPIRTTR